MHLDGIKNIIFDLGRVIIDISEKAAIEAFVQLGAKDIDQLYSRMKQADLFHQHEVGAIGKTAFIDTIRTHLNINKTDQDILNAWDTMLIGIPTARKVLLEQLSAKYRLFLLSNTNELHMRTIYSMEGRQYPTDKLFPYFEKEYYSYRVGLRKPDPTIFELILKENQLKEAATLFVDDSAEHIHAANQLGLKTQLLPDHQTILDLF